ncbi:MAG: DUF4976 domain-containing protein, partial [Cytophagales bacterium]|nr:DUF4976 domain-containing protein [Cytophagales bacterium]
DQYKAWVDAYGPKNTEMKAANLSGQELALWKYNRYIRDYLRCVQSVDDGVGQVLDYLDQNGLTDNTIVVYTSDQGFFLGEHGWFDKRFMYEESFRMPLMMRFPKKIKKGTRVKEFVMNLDFMPTFLDYAGIDVPEDVQGMSFRQVAEGDAPKKWRKSVYYHYYHFPGTHSVKRHYGVRTDRYKLIRFYHDNSEWELYDLKKDPHEMQNVFDNPDYAEVARHMKEVLKENQEMYGETEESGLKAFEDERKGRNRRHS